jgi:proteic killer suppression protein
MLRTEPQGGSGCLDVRFKDQKFDRLEQDPTYDAGFAQAIVTAYRKVMQVIRAAPDERVFYNLKSPHFEKLKGSRSSQHSMRLNKQWQLIIEFEGVMPNKLVAVISIEDYH